MPEPPDRAAWEERRESFAVELLGLPPYSPDFNPIERLWQDLKGHYLAGFLTRSGQELSDKIYNSIRTLLGQPGVIRSVCLTHSP